MRPDQEEFAGDRLAKVREVKDHVGKSQFGPHQMLLKKTMEHRYVKVEKFRPNAVSGELVGKDTGKRRFIPACTLIVSDRSDE